MQEAIRQAATIIRHSRSMVFFGGAGVSTESGIPDFRSADGLYQTQKHLRPEEIVSHHFFVEQPAAFYSFYREKMIFPQALPNVTHRVLAQLERMGIVSCIVTQNIDGLHQMAGSEKVIELHGSIHRNHCMRCGKPYDLCTIMEAETVPHCDCGGIIKPDVVLYEEALNQVDMEHAIRAIEQADVLVVAGTSLTVYPAAGLIRYFHGDHLLLLNRSQTPLENEAEIVVHESMGKVFAEVERMIRAEEQR